MTVVADTSVVLNLARVGQDCLLEELFQQVWIPTEVHREFIRQATMNPRFLGLQPAAWLQIRDPVAVPQSIMTQSHLDPGERAALGLALEIRANAVLIDEVNGREVARHLGLRAIGILGILLQAKAVRRIEAIAPVLRSLEAEAGFWMSETLYRQVLQSAGEST